MKETEPRVFKIPKEDLKRLRENEKKRQLRKQKNKNRKSKSNYSSRGRRRGASYQTLEYHEPIKKEVPYGMGPIQKTYETITKILQIEQNTKRRKNEIKNRE